MKPLRLRENSIALYTLMRREVMRFLRIWVQTLVPPVITVVLYFMIFGEVMGARIGHLHGISYINYIIPGLIMMSVITSSYSNVVSSFFGSKFQKNIEEMMVSPMPNAIMLAGFILGGVIRGLLVGVLVTLAALFFTSLKLHSVGLTLISAFLTATLFSLAGFINGIYARKFDDTSIVPTFILTPLTYLGGIFYSIEQLPPAWQHISRFNPIYYMVNVFRQGMLGLHEGSLTVSLSVLAGLTVLLATLCLVLLHKGVGLRS